MSHHARHRRPAERTTASRTALTLAFTGATAALPLLHGVPVQAASRSGGPVSTAKPSSTPAAGARPTEVVHVVRPGENLTEIARHLGVSGGWPAVYAENRTTIGSDPDFIRPGERLLVTVPAAPPRSGRITRPGPVRSAAAPAAPTTPTAPTAPTAPAAPAAPAARADDVTGAVPAPDGIPGSWTSVFDDEFNGNSLDTANWSTGWQGSGITQPVGPTEQECYDPSEVSVGGGYLHLTAAPKPEECGGQIRPYASGMVTTEGLHSFSHGAFEARVYLPASADGQVANWPAWWVDGQSWPQDGEMDIMEGLSGTTCFHYHDPSGGPGGCAGTGPGWHVFGATWEGDQVTYYYDGHQVGTLTTDGNSAPQYLILNNAVGGSGGETTADTMLVDYVRVWQQS